MLLQNSFEGGTNNTAISTSNSGGTSGDAFDVATNTTYTTAQAAHGTRSAQCDIYSTAVLQWFPSSIPNGSLYSRVDFRIHQRTTDDEFVNVHVGTETVSDQYYQWSAFVLLPSSGSATLELYHYVASTDTNTLVATANITLPLDTWCRLELRADNNATSTAEARFYNSVDSTTVTASIDGSVSHSGVLPWEYAGASMDTWEQSAVNIWLDDFAVTDAGWLGPAGITTVSKSGTDSGSVAGQAGVTAVPSRSDTGLLAEQTGIGLTLAEQAALTEQVALASAPARSDTGELGDQATVAVSHTRTDTATLDEQATIAVAHTRTDTGTLTEAVPVAALTATETATLDETADTDETFGPAVADLFTTGSQATIAATLPLADAGTLADQAELHVLRYGTDTGLLLAVAEAPLVGLPTTDTATLTETGTVTALLTPTDTALLDELAQAVQPMSATDTALLEDLATVISIGGDITRASPPYTAWATSTPYV